MSGADASVRPFSRDFDNSPGVRGFLHCPAEANGDGLVLAHGAGSNARAPLLARVARALADSGVTVLRCDLPFRQLRPHGPPAGGDAARDREGLKRALEATREFAPGRLFAGGHSYGGRQTTMLLAVEPELADALLLMSYPLHPPRRATELRTAHFPNLRTPALFVHGTRDPFGSPEELTAALKLIPARTERLTIEGAGHDLVPGRRHAPGPAPDVAAEIAAAFKRFIT